MQEDIIQLKLDVNGMQKDISQIQTKVDNIDGKVERGFSEVKEMITCLDDKFSAKWVETLLIWIARILGSLILIGGAGLVVKVFIDYATK